jgi:hypothetical protein
MKKQISGYLPTELVARLEDERERMSRNAGCEVSRNAAMAAVLQRGLAQQPQAPLKSS